MVRAEILALERNGRGSRVADKIIPAYWKIYQLMILSLHFSTYRKVIRN